MLRKLIQDWLGLTESYDRQIGIVMRLQKIHDMLADQHHNIRVTNAAIGKVLAALNPLLAMPDDDPARIAASKELGDKIIKRLKDEAKVLEHYNLVPKADE